MRHWHRQMKKRKGLAHEHETYLVRVEVVGRMSCALLLPFLPNGAEYPIRPEQRRAAISMDS